MHPLTVPELLSVWERGLDARPFERAIALLSTATPESSMTSLARVSIGRRDASLLRLREWAFGSALPVVAECPRCHDSLETTLATADLCASAQGAGDSEVSLLLGDYKIRCRAPNSEDLVACVGLDAAAGRQMLLARCVLEVILGNKVVFVGDLPESVIESLIQQIAELDTEIHIDLTCPACAHRWNELFDIVSFFWMEIDAWARRLLREVHVLACAYGWNEQEILSLSPMRRQIYLAMAAG